MAPQKPVVVMRNVVPMDAVPVGGIARKDMCDGAVVLALNQPGQDVRADSGAGRI